MNSQAVTLRIFTEDEGGTEHIGIDNMPVVSAYIADWIEETVALMLVIRRQVRTRSVGRISIADAPHTETRLCAAGAR